MSSIRRSSLSSITLGLLTVIRGYLSFASLGGRQDTMPRMPTSALHSTRPWRGQVRIIIKVEVRTCPLRQL
jgi:hypothetical protein